MPGGKAVPPALRASIQIAFLFAHQNVSAELSKPTAQAETWLRFSRFLARLEPRGPSTTQRNALNAAQNVGLVGTSEGLPCSLTPGALADAPGCHWSV